VLQSYLALERGEAAFRAPNVANFRNLFKKVSLVEYEVDSPSFRKKIDGLVGREFFSNNNNFPQDTIFPFKIFILLLLVHRMKE